MNKAIVPIILILLVLIDFYNFRAIKFAFESSTHNIKIITSTIYWSLTVFTFLFFLFGMNHSRENNSIFFKFSIGMVLGIFVSKILLTFLLLSTDILHFLVNFFDKNTNSNFHIGRRQFIYKTLLGLSALPLVSFINGMISNKYNYKIHKIKLSIKNLPKDLIGLKIVQISDIHCGSFDDSKAVKHGVELIKSLKPDLFFFTGDLVNNKASEFDEYIDIFKGIQAKYGNYSITGNHDYGDYINWGNQTLKNLNFDKLVSHHNSVGWEILLNKNKTIKIGNAKLTVLGVENISAKGFSNYGSLAKAYEGVEQDSFKILLSHDPSHWDSEVNKKYKDINLMLSGHTHGMQFGIETKAFRFSPVQWVYNQWAGLYNSDNQYLYVNRGFGFIGYSGRVGILPEITEIELLA